MPSKKNIMILTQPLRSNYGGLLQTYALQQVVHRMGHSATTDRQTKPASWIRAMRRRVKYHIKTLFAKRKIQGNDHRISAEEFTHRTQYTKRFIDENICTTEFYNDKNNYKRYDAFIVGSDQVWRPLYNDYPPNYFLEFIGAKSTTLRIAYAASYGVDYSEYDKKLQAKCGRLLRRFDAVSVRERSGVELTKALFDVDAKQVLDPTMLLDIEDYNRLIDIHPVDVHNKCILVYLLDNSAEKDTIVANVAKQLNLDINRVKVTLKTYTKSDPSSTKSAIPSIEKWLAGFRDCDFVITDSFHGMVFSLIYNKPFIATVNKERGGTRFDSITDQFGLSDRVIDVGCTSYNHLLTEQIDFERVNKKRLALKIESIEFLKTALQIVTT